MHRSLPTLAFPTLLCLISAALGVVASPGNVLAATTPDNTRPPATTAVVWYEGVDWSDIVEWAGAADRPILIDFHATWCVPCRRLDEMVYTDGEVADLLAGLVTFKVDVDMPAGITLSEQFRIRTLPTLVLCTAGGEEIDRFSGYRPAAEFAQLVRDYLADRGTLADITRRLAADDTDAALLAEAGRKFAARSEYATGRELYERALVQAALLPRPEQARLLRDLADLEQRDGNTRRAVDLVRRTMRDFPDCFTAKTGYRTIARYQKSAGERHDMMSTYRDLVALDPDDVVSLNAFAWNAARSGLALEEATDLARRAVDLGDRAPTYMDTLAEVYYQRGRYSEALKWIKRALAADPDDLHLQDQLSKIRWAALGG